MHFSSSQDTLHTDVIVIGAGVLGTFHAYFAAQKGYQTLLIERNMFPTDASTRNFGMAVQSIVETDGEWASFARASREIYTSIQQEQDIAVKIAGSLYIASTEIERTVLETFAQLYAPTCNCVYWMWTRPFTTILLFRHLIAKWLENLQIADDADRSAASNAAAQYPIRPVYPALSSLQIRSIVSIALGTACR